MIRTWFDAGGPVMWPLLACSVALIAVLAERLWTVGLVGGLARVDLTDSARHAHRRILPFFTEVPPALGLLGTVIGLVQSFALLEGDNVQGGIGAGLAEACTTTVFGLIIAITASIGGYALTWIIGPEPDAATADHTPRRAAPAAMPSFGLSSAGPVEGPSMPHARAGYAPAEVHVHVQQSPGQTPTARVEPDRPASAELPEANPADHDTRPFNTPSADAPTGSPDTTSKPEPRG
ncbi:MAG: MotA/TolQ/ExbB proton channel family protein [Planctomycetota bacterium]